MLICIYAIGFLLLFRPPTSSSVSHPTIKGRERKGSTGVCTNERVQFVMIV